MIPFSPPRIDEKTVEEVKKVLLSGWITTGPVTKKFEEEIRKYVACKKVLCVNSATAGLELSLRWFGVKEGDEVIVPAYTYCATANVVIHCGAKPVLADINENDFNISVDEIKKLITENTKVIIPVDVGGFPCDYEMLNKLVESDEVKKLFNPQTEEQKKLGRILVLSDAAHSIGASVNGIKTGSLTDISVFSFHAVKNLTTGEGGAICFNLPEQFNNDVIYNELNIKSLHGQTKDALCKTRIGNWHYDVIEPGYKCNMPDINAAIGLIELERYESNLKRRKEIFDFYTDKFRDKEWAIIPPYSLNGKESSYHLYLLRIKGVAEEQRNRIISLIYEKGVSVNVHYQPLPMLTAYRNLGYDIANYPVSFEKYQNEISLPVYFDLPNENLNTITEAVINSVKQVIKNN